jgi:hypothetical protein
MADYWRETLANEPYHLPHDEISRLTNAEMFRWHLRLGLERYQKARAASEPGADWSVGGNVFSPETPEEIEQGLAILQGILPSKGPVPGKKFTPSAKESAFIQSMLKLLEGGGGSKK